MLSVAVTMWLNVLQFDTTDYLRLRNKVFSSHHFHKFNNIETRSFLLQCSWTVFMAILVEGKKRSPIVRSSYELRTFDVKHPLALRIYFPKLLDIILASLWLVQIPQFKTAKVSCTIYYLVFIVSLCWLWPFKAPTSAFSLLFLPYPTTPTIDIKTPSLNKLFLISKLLGLSITL